jgi:hypothetical protein
VGTHDLALACADRLDQLANLARRRGDITLAQRYMDQADRNRAYAQHAVAPPMVRLAELDRAVAVARLSTPLQALVG